MKTHIKPDTLVKLVPTTKPVLRKLTINKIIFHIPKRLQK